MISPPVVFRAARFCAGPRSPPPRTALFRGRRSARTSLKFSARGITATGRSRNWGVLGNETPVNDCHAMVQDKRGRLLLLTNESRNNVIIYDRGGKLLGTWGHDFPGAHGMTLVNENGEEFLFITDYARHQVFKTTLDGRVLLTLDAPFESGRFVHADQYKPTHVIAAPDGSFYVLDGYGTSLVLHYDARGGCCGSSADAERRRGASTKPTAAPSTRATPPSRRCSSPRGRMA